MPHPPEFLDAEPTAEAVENDSRLDHPWAVWAVFRDIRTWFFRHGTPPTLEHPRFAVRFLRMLTLMTVLGTVSLLATIGSMGFEQLLEASGVPWPFKGLSLMLLPGVWFGLFVLVPLSRWQGRNWWLTIPAVPVSAGIYWCAVLSFLHFAPILYSEGNRTWPPAGLAAGAVGGLALSLWINVPRSQRAFCVITATLFAAILGAECFAYLFHNEPIARLLPEPLHRLLFMAALYGPFHVGVAMAMGMRLVYQRAGCRGQSLRWPRNSFTRALISRGHPLRF